MSPIQVVLLGSVTQDGALELNQPVKLPPGPVEVTITVVGQPKASTWTVLERIWADRRARKAGSRTREEIDAEINALRDEADEEMREIESTYEQARRAREQPPC